MTDLGATPFTNAQEPGKNNQRAQNSGKRACRLVRGIIRLNIDRGTPVL